MAEEQLPSEDAIREALDRVGVADVLVEALTAAVSLGYHRLSPDARDLAQTRLAIEALRALDPVLRDGGVPEGIVRDLEQARANLQLAYASAVADVGPDAATGASSAESGSGASESPASDAAAPDPDETE